MFIFILICVTTSMKKVNITFTALHNDGFWIFIIFPHLMC